MKRTNALRLMLMLGLAALLAAGCAKKTAPETVTAPPVPPAATQEPQVVTEPAPQPVPGIREQVVSEAPATAPVLAAAQGLQTVYFDYDQFTLSDAARQTLAANAAWLKTNDTARVMIEGYCDESGSY
jgi:peptidoglycan-associated lipoprotein